MKKTKILSLLITIAMIVQTFSLLTISASAAQYDNLSVTKFDPVWVNSGSEDTPVYEPTINGRITDIVVANIEGELYAYVGLNTSSQAIKDPLDTEFNTGKGGMQVWNVTNPKTPKLVQTISGDKIRTIDPQLTGEKFAIKDGYLILANGANNKVQGYLINENGTIDAQSPVWQYDAKNATIKLYENYLLISRSAAESMEIYDISSVKTPVKITSETPISPIMDVNNTTKYPGGVKEQIATFNFDVLKLSDSKFRIFAYNRAKYYSDAEKTSESQTFFLSIRDIEVADGKYTVTTKLEENPSNTFFTLTSSIKDIEILDSTHFAACYDVNDTTTQNVQVFAINETTGFNVTKVSEINVHRAISLNCAPGGELIVGSESGGLHIYAYNDGALTFKKTHTNTHGQKYNHGVYAGFLYAAEKDCFSFYEYSNAISIDEVDISSVVPVITGSVEGFLPDTDSVMVTVDGKNYTAQMNGTKFKVDLTEELTSNTISVSATLNRNSSVKATDTANLKVKVLSDKVYGDATLLTESLSIDPGHVNAHGASAQGITVNGRDYLYYYTVSGLAVFDITDGASSVEGLTPIQTISTVAAKDITDQLLIYKKYVVLANGVEAVEFYAIGNDGKLPATPTSSIEINIDKGISLEIVDNYLFAGLGGANRCVKVYDISDISNIRLVGTTDGYYGAHGVAVEKISNTVYRIYFASRTNKTDDNGNKLNTDGYGLYIADMTVANNGTVSFEEKYNGDPGINGMAGGTRGVELVDAGKLFVANCYSNSNSTIIDVSNVSAPVVNDISGRSLSAISLGENYYAVGTQDGVVKIINAQDNTVANTLTGAGQIYGLSEFDGKLVAAGSQVKIFNGAYTKIVLDNSDVLLAANVKIAGKVEGYVSGDKVTMTIDGEEYSPTIDGKGNFYCTYEPGRPKTIKVKARLERNSSILIATEANINIVNEYSDLPEMYFDNQMTILSTVELKDSEEAPIWSSSNRLSSVAVVEIGEKTFAYAGSYSNLIVFDITDPTNPVLVENYEIAVADSNTFNKGLAVYNGYLIVRKPTTQKVEVYKLGTDGRLSTEVVDDIDVAANRITVEDNYLFVSNTNAHGLQVYDISDVTNIKLIGNVPAVSQVRTHTVEKIAHDTYRVYMIVRENSNWYIGIYDVNISNGTLTYTEYYKGNPATGIDNYSAIKEMIKVGNTLVVGSLDQKMPLEFIDISNPRKPELSHSIANIRLLSGVALTDTQFVYSTTDATAAVYSTESGTNIIPFTTLSTTGGPVYQTLYHNGNLIFAIDARMCIASLATEVVVDETVLKGKAPVLSGEVYGYKTGDKLLASINNEEAIEIAVKADATFDIPMTSAFADSDVAGVQLVIERNGENILGEYLSVEYLGEYAYEILDVTNDDGISVVLEKNYDAVSAKVYIAAYEGDELKAVDMFDAAEGTLPSNITFNPQTQTLKVFVWDANLTPVAQAVTPVFASVSQNF